ncbi:MAG: hypothetical protein ACTSRZ_13975 [Promethearchaeota archaeon]
MGLMKVLFYLAGIFFAYYSIKTGNLLGIFITIGVVYLIIRKNLFGGSILGSAGVGYNSVSIEGSSKRSALYFDNTLRILSLQNSSLNRMKNGNIYKKFLSAQHKLIYNLFVPTNGPIVQVPLKPMFKSEGDLYSTLVPYVEQHDYVKIRAIFLKIIDLALDRKLMEIECRDRFLLKTHISKLEYIASILSETHNISYFSDKVEPFRLVISKQKPDLEDIVFLVDLYFSILYFHPVFLFDAKQVSLVLNNFNIKLNDYLSPNITQLSLIKHLYPLRQQEETLGSPSMKYSAKRKFPKNLIPIMADFTYQQFAIEEKKIKEELAISGNINKAIIEKIALSNEKKNFRTLLYRLFQINGLSSKVKGIFLLLGLILIAFGILILLQNMISPVGVSDDPISYWGPAIEIFRTYGYIILVSGIALTILAKFF